MDLRIEFSTTNVLIIINVFLYLAASLFSGGNILDPTLDALNFLGADNYARFVDGELWRAVTSSFLHANIYHLLLNMYALFYFGNFFESQYGGKKLFSIYILTGMLGSLMSLAGDFVSIEFMGDLTYSIGVGASGALFGILGYFVVVPSLYIDKQRLYLIIILNLFLGFAVPNIDNSAHLGGLFGGMLLGIFDEKFRGILWENRLYWLSMAIMGTSYIGLTLFNILEIF